METQHFCAIAHPPLTSVQHAVGVRGKYWEPGYNILIAFVGGTQAQHDFVVKASAGWLPYINLQFSFNAPAEISDVRISFVAGAGSWSYVGTDCSYIPKNQATMNFGWLDEAVVLHEFGHTLGLAHEHQNPNQAIKWNRQQVYADLSQAPNYWDRPTIDSNIFELYAPDMVDTSPLDKGSIMLYQVPSRWTLDGFSAGFNKVLSDRDKEFIGGIYRRTPEEPTLPEILQGVFTSRREIARLHEHTLVRLGKNLGVDVDEKLYKRENVKLLAKALGVK